MITDLQKYKIRNLARGLLLEMRENGTEIANLNGLLDEIMQDFETKGIMQETFNKITKWETIGRINNLFKLRA